MDEVYPEPPAKRRWNLLGCLVLIAIVVTLIGMILPVVGQKKSMAWNAMCGKNQSQLLGALVAYSTEFEVIYPGPLHPAIGPVVDAHQARLVTHQMLWILARHHALPPSLLVCPKTRRATPTKPEGVRPSLTWGFEPGVAVYCFDWAAPADPPAARVVMADRDQRGHEGKVLGVFGDGHVQALRLHDVTRAKEVLVTEGPDGTAVTMGTATPFNDREDDGPGPPDDIYSNDQDGAPDSNVLRPGEADPLRAWVK